MKNIKNIFLLGFILLMISLILGCTKNITASSSIYERKIANAAVILFSYYDPYSVNIKESLENIEKESPDKIKFNFFDAKDNIAIQNEIIDSLLKDNIDLLVIGSVNVRESTIEDIINRVKLKNIPLIFIGIDPKVIASVSKYYDKMVFLGANIAEGAIIEGNILVNKWKTNKKDIDRNNDDILQYILLEGKADNPITTERTKYSVSAINEAGIKTEQLVSAKAEWSKELARDTIDGLFLRYNDKIEAIIANNDAMAIGAIEALQKYGYNKGDKTKNIEVVGIDGLTEAKNLIDKGFMLGTVIQDPKILAEGIYNVGLNMINNVEPLENTNYKMINGEIIIPISYKEYTNTINNK